MKKVFFLSILAAAVIVLASFTKHTSTQAPGAQPYNLQASYDYTGFSTYDPCTGEIIDLSGTEHQDIHGVYNPNTNTTKETYHVNLQGVSGVGETSGNTYQITGGSTTQESLSSDGCIMTEKESETLNFTTPGPNNNYYVKYRVTVMYNFCTGEYTVTRDIEDQGCR